jgi:hypothetical protein
MASGLALILVGTLLIAQATVGNALQRLGVLSSTGSPS